MSAANTKFRTFGSGVKIGNWNEDKFLQQKNETEFQAKLNGGELNFQKSDRAIAEVTSGVEMTSSNDGTLHFGDTIMFTHTPSNSVLASLPNIRPTASVSDSIVCTGASAAVPNSRTVFTIIPHSEGNMGNTVTYGDKMYLKLLNPLGNNSLFLRSLNPTLNVPVARFSGEQKVDFVEVDSAETPPRDCMWELISSEAKSRPESEGAPVSSTSNVHIKHAATGQCLACLHNLRKKIISDFGADHEITCKTRVAGKVMGEFVTEDENLWTITMA